ncbi:hypothetical protein [Streptomyces sp. 1222.5]|uniref:hypothetical protein n=1 Tax=Streptomyces sp. 1222.5 TaxID=1881026 RepID=UPI003D7271EA
MKKKRRVAASLAAAVVMTFAGVGTAHAAKQPGAANGMTTRAGIASLGGCDNGHDCPKPPPVPTGCFDIDSAVQDPDKFISVVCDGRVYVLTVREAPPTAPQPVGDWQFVGGPTNVVDATLSTRANEVYVSVLTATGTVFQGVCTATEPLTVPCTFTQMPTPP